MIDAMDGLIIGGQKTKCFKILDDLLHDRKQINQLSEPHLNQFIKEFNYFSDMTEAFIGNIVRAIKIKGTNKK